MSRSRYTSYSSSLSVDEDTDGMIHGNMMYMYDTCIIHVYYIYVIIIYTLLLGTWLVVCSLESSLELGSGCYSVLWNQVGPGWSSVLLSWVQAVILFFGTRSRLVFCSLELGPGWSPVLWSWVQAGLLFVLVICITYLIVHVHVHEWIVCAN